MAIKIYRDAIDPKDLDALIKLVEDAGYEVEVVDGAPDDHCQTGSLVAVIIYDAEPPSAALQAVLRNGDNGERVIGVWPKGCSATSVPDHIDNCAIGSSPWSPTEFEDTVNNPRFKLPSGSDRPPVKTTHKNCP